MHHFDKANCSSDKLIKARFTLTTVYHSKAGFPLLIFPLIQSRVDRIIAIMRVFRSSFNIVRGNEDKSSSELL